MYSENKNVKINSNMISRCVKYNLLAPAGAYNIIRPYLSKIFKDGYLMPKEYRKLRLVERAIELFGKVYESFSLGVSYNDTVISSISENYIYDFINNYNERKEILQDAPDKNFCELIDNWDIHPDLIRLSGDSLRDKFEKMLVKSFS